jgi:hypothetical protein
MSESTTLPDAERTARSAALKKICDALKKVPQDELRMFRETALSSRCCLPSQRDMLAQLGLVHTVNGSCRPHVVNVLTHCVLPDGKLDDLASNYDDLPQDVLPA